MKLFTVKELDIESIKIAQKTVELEIENIKVALISGLIKYDKKSFNDLIKLQAINNYLKGMIEDENKIRKAA